MLDPLPPNPLPSNPLPSNPLHVVDGLTVAVSRTDRVAVLSVRGEIDARTTPRLESGLQELFGRPAERFVVDLSEVSFLASSGLAVLISATRLAAQNGRRLALVATTRAVRRPLQITGSDQLFDVFDTLDAACGHSV